MSALEPRAGLVGLGHAAFRRVRLLQGRYCSLLEQPGPARSRAAQSIDPGSTPQAAVRPDATFWYQSGARAQLLVG